MRTKKLFAIFVTLVLVMEFLPVGAFAHHRVDIEVDKPKGYYPRGATVTVTATNNGNDDAIVSCHGIYIYQIFNANWLPIVAYEKSIKRLCPGVPVYSDSAYTLKPGDSHTWDWDQKYRNGSSVDGLQVEDGTYQAAIDAFESTSNSVWQQVSSKFYIEIDQDLDGITDSQDTDRDGDKIENGADKCPDQPIYTDSNGDGCDDINGDMDNDGIPDNQDSDMDGDGVLNEKDMCPNNPGLGTDLNGDGCEDAPHGDTSPRDITEEIRNTVAGEAGKVKKSAEEKSAATVNMIGKGMIAGGATGVAVGIGGGLGGLFGAGVACLIFCTAELVGWGVAVEGDAAVVGDPPDPNYKVPVRLEYRSFKPITSADVLPEAESLVPFANKKLKHFIDYTDAVRAYIHANEKYMGAEQAKDYEWMHTHAVETRRFAALLSFRIEEDGRVFEEIKSAALSRGLDPVVTRTDLINFQNNLRANGSAALPQFEVSIMKNNLGFSDADVQRILVEPNIELDPNMWADEKLSAKFDRLVPLVQRMKASFESIATNFGSNIFLDESPSAQSPTFFVKEIPLEVADTSGLARTIIIGLSYDNRNSKFIGMEPLMQVSGLQYLALETEPGRLMVILHSPQGIPAGTSGTAANLKFSVRGLGILPALFGQWDVSARITGLAGDSIDWLFPSRSLLRIQEPGPLVPVYKNGFWTWVEPPETPPPAYDPSVQWIWWDGVSWIFSTPSQYGIVWTGTGWSGTGTPSPRGPMYSDENTPADKVYVWTGSEYILVDRTLIESASLPEQIPVFDVGTKTWTFTSVMPPRAALV